MTSIFRKSLFVTLGWCAVALGQRDVQPSEDQQRTGVVSFEVIPVFSEDTTTSMVNVHYRIPEDFFIVLRYPENLQGSEFIGKGELLTELRSKTGGSVAREIRSIRIRRTGLRRDQAQTPDIQGAFSLKVQPGSYTVWFSVDDMQSERTFTSRDQIITARNRVSSGLDFSAPILCFPVPDSAGNPHYEALNHGTEVFFGNKGGLLFNLAAPGRVPELVVRYRLKHQPDYKGMGAQEFEGGAFVLHPGIAQLVPHQSGELSASREPIRYTIAPAESTWQSIFIPLPLEKLQPGQAQLSLEFESGKFKRTFDRSFRVLWPDRPKSLVNVDMAVDALQHIASDEVMERFRTFSNPRYVKALFDFWRQMDPDTSTAYNGVMAEYYRRVDIANQRFSTSRAVDGYKSDQGRIFILYGSPANTERLFSPQHPPREVWTYPTARRRFVFEDQTKSGIYMLVSAEDL